MLRARGLNPYEHHLQDPPEPLRLAAARSPALAQEGRPTLAGLPVAHAHALKGRVPLRKRLRRLSRQQRFLHARVGASHGVG